MAFITETELRYAYLKKLAQDAKLDISKYNRDQVVKGFNTEKEHDRSNDVDVSDSDLDTLKIAIAHLRELPDYYTRLEKMERTASNPTKKNVKEELKQYVSQLIKEYKLPN